MCSSDLAGGGSGAVAAEQVLGGASALVYVAGRNLGPSLDQGESAFDAGLVALHGVNDGGLGDGVGRADRDEVLDAGEDEGVGVGPVAGKLLFGFAANGREGKGPTKAEDPISGAGIVAEAEGGGESAAAGRKRKGDGEGGGASRGVGLELFADALEGTAALWDLDAGCYLEQVAGLFWGIDGGGDGRRGSGGPRRRSGPG